MALMPRTPVDTQPQTSGPAVLPTLPETPLPTGIPGLDEMLGGGIPPCSLVFLCGPPGAGKTIIAQQMAYATANAGHKALYITTLSEPIVKLVRDLQSFTFFEPSYFNVAVKYQDLSDAVRSGQMGDIPLLIESLVAQHQPSLLVIDSIKPALDALDNPAAQRRLMYSIGAIGIEAGLTALLIGEYMEEELLALPEIGVADGIISLTAPFQSPDTKRYARILKMRGACHLHAPTELQIQEAGARILSCEG